MKLKCIGGPSDGNYFEIDAAHNYARLADPAKRRRIGEGPSNGDFMSAISFTVYTRRLLRCVVGGKVKEIQYLAPEGLDDIESIRHLFE